MISHKYKFVFLHIPKTGGLSVIEALKPFCDNPNFTFTGGFGHPKQSFFYEWDITGYYQFSFVRNPFSRLVSSYFFIKNGGICEHDKRVRDKLGLKEKTFKQFVQHLHPENSSVHFHRQIGFMNKDIDKINWFNMENYQSNFNTVCDKIGIPRQQLPHRNKTKHKHYTLSLIHI